MSHDPFPSLLNEYKFTLTRRRLLKTLTGGVLIQRLPISIHILQWLLWTSPVILFVPFIATGNLWNVYYLGLVYSVICGTITLCIGCIVKLCFWKLRNRNLSVNENYDEEEEEGVVISSFFSAATLDLVFPQKHWIIVIVHAFLSSLTCYSSITVLDVFMMKEIVSIPATPFIFSAGLITLCTAHYSLVAKPPNEMIVYRQPHHDKLQLFYLRRPVYVILVGVGSILLRNFLGDSTLFLIIPYVLFCTLSILWSLSVLPPIDALILWVMEQIFIHLMGGSPASSEMRLFVQFLLALGSGLVLIWISNHFVVALLACGLGFVLSQNFIHWTLLISPAVNFLIPRLMRSSIFKKTSNDWYSTSYCMIDFHWIKTSMQTLICSAISSIRSIILLILSLVITSQTFGRGTGTSLRARVVTAMSYSVIGVFVVTKLLKMSAGTFMCCGLVRNPFHPHKTEPLSYLKRRKFLLLLASIPNQIMTLYVVPLILVTYISLLLDINRISNDIWFGITTLRLYRKIWQNSLSSLTESTIVSVLFLSLSSGSSWSSLGIGTQALLISLALYFTNNVKERFKLFIILFIAFMSNCSKNPIFVKSCTLSIFFIPFSLFSLLLSAVLSSPLIPLFTLPILIVAFPRPQHFWPSFVDPRSQSQTYESSYYKQSLTTVSKSISTAIRVGVTQVNPGDMFLIRFQDRLSLVRVTERGYSYCIIYVQGLELQETSCHASEASAVDEYHETLYADTDNRKNICTHASSWFNKYSLHHFQPIDVSIGQVYSDARNSLAGIVDRSDSLLKFSENLFKTLIWVFVKHLTTNIASGVKIKHKTGLFGSQNEEQKFTSGSEIAIEKSSTYGVGSIISPSHIFLKSSKVQPVSSSASLYVFPTAVPLTTTELSRVPAHFPNDWFDFIVLKICGTSSKRNIIESFKNVMTTCFALFDVPTASALFSKTSIPSKTQPGNIYKGFCGEYTTSLGIYGNQCKSWMNENPILRELTNKAYRYAVKLLYDEAVLGEILDNSELLETLEDYDNNWYIGHEGTREGEWEKNVISERRSLFSVGHSENCYTAHVLTLQDEVIFLGQLNQSLIEGIWSNVSFELQYLTNDDEERYSIQAQPRLLRNLMTQSAEVPYGYQIFTSDLITVPSI